MAREDGGKKRKGVRQNGDRCPKNKVQKVPSKGVEDDVEDKNKKND